MYVFFPSFLQMQRKNYNGIFVKKFGKVINNDVVNVIIMFSLYLIIIFTLITLKCQWKSPKMISCKLEMILCHLNKCSQFGKFPIYLTDAMTHNSLLNKKES